MVRSVMILVMAFSFSIPMSLSAEDLQAGAATADFEADDSLVIGGGILPGKAKGQEGKLRASAVVVRDPKGAKVALVACDVLMINRDILDRAAHRIEAETKILFDHILINATHTHHAPTTVSVHGYEREEAFTKQVEDKIVQAAINADHNLKDVEFRYRKGEESSVGKNSRLLLGDGTIFWIGTREDTVRPTGPFDPDLPVLAFLKSDGKPEAVLFNHSTHTIGSHAPGVRSPSFYGLAAQELEAEKGGTFIFFEGASGSTHNLDVTPKESTVRIKAAVTDALEAAPVKPVARVQGIRKELTLHVRKFDEAKEDAAVSSYCEKRVGGVPAKQIIDVFRSMRKELQPKQGEERKTWIQVIMIGDVALVGVPAEFFTKLGQEIKRRSPFRDTFVFELANDYVGYIPDTKAHDKGGYQVWTGRHSFLEQGSGEIIVDEVVGLLNQVAK